MKHFVEQFLLQVEKNSGRPAILDSQGAYSYEELNRRTACLAGKIRAAVGGKGRVALLFPRSKDFAAAELAVLRAGCCVVPLSVDNPAGRIKAFLDNAECDFILAAPELRDAAGGVPVLSADEMWEETGDIDPALNLSEPDDEAYLFTTSGSTGAAKGVLQRHAMLDHIPDAVSGFVTLTEESRSLHIIGFDFIGSLLDLLPLIYFGGSVYVAGREEQKNIGSLARIIKNQGITCMNTVPAMYRILRRFCDLSKLDYVMMGSEKVTDEIEDPNVFEVYGASEACPPVIYSQVCSRGGPMVLGRPVRDADVYLMDENGEKITESGRTGEICVSSCCVAREYIHMPELTAERFTEDPYEPGRIIFHTGDQASYDENGDLVFHGRKDRMIKRSGFRVELGAIDQAVRQAEEIDEAAAVSVPFRSGSSLCCFYTGEEKTEDELKDHVRTLLPEYMVPDRFIHLEEMPRNDRKKTDFPALKVLAGEWLPAHS